MRGSPVLLGALFSMTKIVVRPCTNNLLADSSTKNNVCTISLKHDKWIEAKKLELNENQQLRGQPSTSNYTVTGWIIGQTEGRSGAHE